MFNNSLSSLSIPPPLYDPRSTPFHALPSPPTPRRNRVRTIDQILAFRPMWRNFFENSATVQADHRALALTTTGAALGMFWYARRGAGGGTGSLWAALPAGPRAATTATAGLVTAQVNFWFAASSPFFVLEKKFDF